MRNPIEFFMPKIVYDECFIPSDNNTRLYKKLQKGVDISLCEVGIETHMCFFNILNPENLTREALKSHSGFASLRLLSCENGWGVSELAYLFVSDPLIKQIALMHFYS